MPSPTPPSRHPTRTAPGIARLEFALTVIVAGVIATMAMDRVSQLRSAADVAKAETAAAQRRSMTVLAQARNQPPDAFASGAPAAACPVSLPWADRNDAASHPVSCSSIPTEGVFP